MVKLDGIDDSPGFQEDMVLRDMDVYMEFEGDSGFVAGGEGRKAIGLGQASHDVFSKNLRKDDDEGNFKFSGMMKSLRLPTELASFALSYEKAYCSSLFMGDCWATDRPLSRIDMPFRMRPQKPLKTKVGCLTCKVRRVKCDDLRPTCLRCRKMGLKCGGYHIPQRENTRSHPGTTRRAVAPKFLLLHPYSLSEVMLFQTDQEYQYFKVFSEKVGRESEHSLLLQVCQSEPFLRRAIIALVALEKMSTALSNSEDVGGKPKDSLDSAIEDGNVVKDDGKLDTMEQVERSRNQLLSFVCLIYRKKIPGNHESRSCKSRLEAISAAFRAA